MTRAEIAAAVTLGILKRYGFSSPSKLAHDVEPFVSPIHSAYEATSIADPTFDGLWIGWTITLIEQTRKDIRLPDPTDVSAALSHQCVLTWQAIKEL